MAQFVRTGKGFFGSSRDYVEATVRSLAKLDILDAGFKRLRRAIRQADRAKARKRPALTTINGP